jgi:hypothetical protein
MHKNIMNASVIAVLDGVTLETPWCSIPRDLSNSEEKCEEESGEEIL